MPTVARVIKLADAVTTELNAPQSPTVWDNTFTAARAKFVLTQPKDLGSELKVTVVPGSEEDEISDHETDERTFEIGIYLQAAAATEAAGDLVINQAEQISDYWRCRTPAAYAKATCVKRSKPKLYDVDALHQSQIATVPLILTFVLYE